MVRANKRMEAGFYSPIATKVSAEDRAKLEIIAHGFNMSVYELLQGLLLALIRYFDTASIITHEHNTMMNAFANTMFALKGSFNPLAKRDRNRESLISVCKDGCGNLKESYNIETMLTDFLGAFDPETLQALKQLKDYWGYFSIAHTLHETILKSKPAPADTMREEIKAEFEDIRIATGDKPNEDVHHKSTRTHWESCTAPAGFSMLFGAVACESSRIYVFVLYLSNIMLVSFKYHALNTFKLLIISVLLFVYLECLADICSKFQQNINEYGRKSTKGN